MVTFHALYIIIRDNKLAIVFLFRQPPHPPPPPHTIESAVYAKTS